MNIILTIKNITLSTLKEIFPSFKIFQQFGNINFISNKTYLFGEEIIVLFSLEI